MIIKKSALIQYALIYLMMIYNGGVLYYAIQGEQPIYNQVISYAIILLGFIAIPFNKKKYSNQYCLYISLILAIGIIVVRYMVGGVGLSVLVEYLSCIMMAFLAVCVDKNMFSTRMINVVYYFAGLSVVCYLIQLFSPDILKTVLTPFNSTFSYNDWSAAAYGGSAIRLSYTAWGKLFFTMREGEMTRNLGIFTEPGNYQIVLNCALFLLLFLPQFYLFDRKQIRRRFIVITLTVLTTQSTSGYLILLSYCIAFFFVKKYENLTNIRKTILGSLFFAAILLVLDYNIRGNESLLYTALIGKLFSDGNVDITASTGVWRLGTIGTSVLIMITHPLGAGFDDTFSTIQQQLAGAAGGALMAFGAALGVIPFFATIIWHIRPVIKSSNLITAAKIVFMILFFQSTMAQSKVFYPFIVSIVILLVVNRRNNCLEYDTDASIEVNL